MGLDATAWGAQASAFAEYVEGDAGVRLELTPAAGGDPIPFIHDERSDGYDVTEAGAVTTATLAVFTRTPLERAAVYTYDGSSWTCDEAAPNVRTGADFPSRAVLVRHAE